MKYLVTLALLGAVASAQAGTVYVDREVPSNFVAFENAPRVLHFSYSRTWFTNDGMILLCPEGSEVKTYEKVCKEPKKGGADRWVAITDYPTMKAFEVVGYSFAHPGTYDQVLTVYWRPIKSAVPVVAPVAPTPIEKVAATPAKVGIIQTDVITINAGKVVVQRNKK